MGKENWPDFIEGTGVFATPSMIEDLKRPTPMIWAGGPPMGHKEKTHRYALARGLPDIQGSYGVDLETGEFVKPKGQ